MATTIVVGLTGQTGAGKSLVSSMLAEQGCKIIDADLVSRSVVMPDKPCLRDLTQAFGTEILDGDGKLNRKKLGAIVFADAKKRAELNGIIFPYIQDEINAELAQLRLAGEPVVFLDAPTLFESGSEIFCDKVVSVIAPAELRQERIQSRDGISEADALLRMGAQQDDAYYTARSDFVIRNNADLSKLKAAVLAMLDGVLSGESRV